MNDLEITKKCAEAMGYKFYSGTEIVTVLRGTGAGEEYDPLHDDAQAMALVKKFGLTLIMARPLPILWQAAIGDEFYAEDQNLNRAICECVAKMP